MRVRGNIKGDRVCGNSAHMLVTLGCMYACCVRLYNTSDCLHWVIVESFL
jgi:hypothetical protein